MDTMERRRETRIDVSWPLQVAGLCGTGEGSVINISLCGVLFSTDLSLKEKQLLVLRIHPDADTTIDCVAQVVRMREQDGRPACAADFRFLSAADRQRLNFALLLQRDPACDRRSCDQVG